MAEKNTLSILESIRKKIQKLEEPRKSDSKDFSDIADEFDYTAPVKKTTNGEDVAIEASPVKNESVKVDIFDDAMEREITQSFEVGDDENAEENFVEEDLVDGEIDDLEFEEDFLDEEESADPETNSEDNADEDNIEEEEVLVEEPVESDLELTDETETVEEFLDTEDDDLELDDSDFVEDEAEAEEFEEDPEEQEDAEGDFLTEEPLTEESQEDSALKEELERPQSKIQEKPQVEKSDEDELEELLKQEAASKVKENKSVSMVNPVPMFVAASVDQASYVAPMPAAPLAPISPIVDVAKKFDNVDEFLTHTSTQEPLINQQAASNITDSIKKLVDAKNVVSGVTSFSKSEAFADIAAQLMEPRLEKWLNEHLPALVENIVREEIKKIIPKE